MTLADAVAATAAEWRRRSRSLPDNVLYVPDRYWTAYGAEGVHASAARVGVVAKRVPKIVADEPSVRPVPNRADRRTAARTRRR